MTVKHKRPPVKVGDIFSTNRCGNCEVIVVSGTGAAGTKVTVKFINTGTIKDCSVCNLRKGSVSDSACTAYKDYLNSKLPQLGDTFSTNYSGYCIVTDVIDIDSPINRRFVVKFSATGNTTKCTGTALKSGLVNDKQSINYKSQPKLRKHSTVSVGDEFTTNSSGVCKVTSVDGNGTSNSSVIVIFTNTGNTTTTKVSSLREGKVRDRNNPSVFGIGYLGDGHHKASDPAYDLWYAIMQRCYNPNYYNKHTESSYGDVEVCKEWHNYQNFAEFYVANYVKNFQIDKDLLNPGSKVYSPENCLFVSRTVNNAEAALRKLATEDSSYIPIMEAFRLQAINQGMSQ